MGALRAKRPTRERHAPSVGDTQALLQTIRDVGGYPTNLIARLLYGCGMRVSEPLNVRVKDVNLESGRLCIRGAKGGNDRVVRLPSVLVPDLQRQLRAARLVWQQDKEDRTPLALPHRLARKYPEYQFSWRWAWVFPAHFNVIRQFADWNYGFGPEGSLTISDTTLYGTTTRGGPTGDPLEGWGMGEVFKVNTDGTGFSVLHTFMSWDGLAPHEALLLSRTRLYGTTPAGGNPSGPGLPPNGTVFALNTDGTGFTILHNFTSMITNYDGASPEALVLLGGQLYGSAWAGGWGWGAMFRLNIDGTDYKTLYNFQPGLLR